MPEEKFEELKKELKEIDKELIRLLNQRADFSLELNNLKIKEDVPLYNGFEEMELMESLEKYSDYTNMIQTIYPAILKYSRTLYEDQPKDNYLLLIIVFFYIIQENKEVNKNDFDANRIVYFAIYLRLYNFLSCNGFNEILYD